MSLLKLSIFAFFIFCFQIVFCQNVQKLQNEPFLKGVSIKEVDGKIRIWPSSTDSTISSGQIFLIIQNSEIKKYEFHDFKGKIDINGDAIARIKNTRKQKPNTETDTTCFTSEIELFFVECTELLVNDCNLKTVNWMSHKGADFVEVNNSVINELVIYSWFNYQEVWLNRNCFGSADIFSIKPKTNSLLSFTENTIIGRQMANLFTNIKFLIPGRVPKYCLFSLDGNYEIVEFNQNKIIDRRALHSINFNPECEKFVCQQNQFDSTFLIMNDLKATSSFRYHQNSHQGKLGIKGIEFPPKTENTYLDWKEISGHKILTFSNMEAQENWLTGTQKLDGFMIPSSKDTIYQNFSLFKNLTSQYKSVLDLFKAQGDQISYNGCYKEMKEIQTQYFQVQYTDNKSVEGWFNWRINQFLNWYCDYGTNPVKALIYCFYVLLLFSGLYVIFPSESDNLTSGSLIQYFNSKIAIFYLDGGDPQKKPSYSSESMAKLQELARLIRTNKKETPVALSWFGAPITQLMLLYLNLRLWLITKFAMPENRLPQKSKTDRLVLGTWITLNVIGFLFWGLVMRILNAFALSLNAFVTLGYGEIEAKGISRYLAVLEGAFGWFFLGIFSVSLISQILQ
jgi:hypothetical protein